MEKKRPIEKPELSTSTTDAATISALEKKVKILMGACGVMLLLVAFLTYNAFFAKGVSSADIAQTKAALQSTNPTAGINGDPNQQPIKPTEPMVPQVDPNTATTIAFEESVFDYGKINEGEKVRHVYKFKNTGNKPLIITDAKGSCGCTVPQYSKEPVAPGAEGEINVEFDSKGKTGLQNKQVTITANTIPAQTMLSIKGEVVKLEGVSPDAPKSK